MQLENNTTTRQNLEITSVILVALGKFVFMDWLHVAAYFIVTNFAIWIIYIFIRNNRIPGTAEHWGFRSRNFWAVARRMALPAIGVLAACMIAGYFLGNYAKVNVRHFLILFIGYPLWGVIQQYLCMALFAGNLQDKSGSHISKRLIVFITALLFGGMHLPDPILAGATFIMAILYGYFFFQERNLYVLGLLHGWLGTVFYFLVLGKDPFLRLSE